MSLFGFPLLSVSRDNDANEPVYLEAKKGLNGLRVGSLAWASFFARIVREAGLESSVTEPCLYAGSVGGAPVVLICYVDDVLVATPKEASHKVVFDLLAKHVKIRETGRIPLASAKDGSLRFLGRTISRKAGDAALYLSVDPDYMDECFREFGIEKGSTTFPDIRPAISPSVGRCQSPAAQVGSWIRHTTEGRRRGPTWYDCHYTHAHAASRAHST